MPEGAKGVRPRWVRWPSSRPLTDLRPESLVRLREALEARFDGSRLTTRVGWLDFPEEDLPSVRRLLEGGEYLAADIGLELAERLLRAGVLVPVGQ